MDGWNGKSTRTQWKKSYLMVLFKFWQKHTQSPARACNRDVRGLLRRPTEDAVSICIKNTDNLCMAEALLVEKGVADGKDWHKRLIRAQGLQTRVTKKSTKGAELKERKFTQEDVSAFEMVNVQRSRFVARCLIFSCQVPLGYQAFVVSAKHLWAIYVPVLSAINE